MPAASCYPKPCFCQAVCFFRVGSTLESRVGADEAAVIASASLFLRACFFHHGSLASATVPEPDVPTTAAVSAASFSARCTTASTSYL
jgi:hypothetical protein